MVNQLIIKNKLFCHHCFKSVKIMVINPLIHKQKYTFPHDYICQGCEKKAFNALKKGYLNEYLSV